ncbi:Uma2 family endonuclease [Akkermansiaceae bacterium]|nr:Uma2 family endonuclease [Akkermansiaceae bacterium]
MTALVKHANISVEEYLEGEILADVRHEYIGGTVHAMAGGTNNHAEISANTIGTLFGYLKGKPCKAFTSDTKVRLELSDHTRFYYPDVQVVCDSKSGTSHYQDRPVVIIEVLSKSTRRTDLGEKRDAYLAIPTLKVLLFIESEAETALVLRRKPSGGFAEEFYTGREAVIALAEIEAALPLADVFDGIVFPENA